MLSRPRRDVRQSSAFPPSATATLSPRFGRGGQFRFQQRTHVAPHCSPCAGRITPGNSAWSATGRCQPATARLPTACSPQNANLQASPPKSTMHAVLPNPHAASTASLPSRDSSPALITSSAIPLSLIVQKRFAVSALRVALVATARYRVTPNSSITSRKCGSFESFLETSSLKRWRRKKRLPQTQRIAFLMHRLDVERGIGGAQISAARWSRRRLRQCERLRHFGIYRQRYQVRRRACIRAANPQLFADALAKLFVHGGNTGLAVSSINRAAWPTLQIRRLIIVW